MRAKLVVDVDANPRTADERAVKDENGRLYYPAGTVFDHPRAFRMVQMGTAEPDDEECTLRVCMTKEEMKAAQRQQEMVSKGIHPIDYQRYLDGEILGYDEDGEDIPGPNWIAPEDEDTEEDEDGD